MLFCQLHLIKTNYKKRNTEGQNVVKCGHEFEPTPGDSEGQGSLVCCSPWGHKELNTTLQLNNYKKKAINWFSP